jgi:hypothetical protein
MRLFFYLSFYYILSNFRIFVNIDTDLNILYYLGIIVFN